MKLVNPAVGSIINLPEEEKRRVNIEIDKKMAELEATGLSREEILLSTSRVIVHLYAERHTPCFRSVLPVSKVQLFGSRNLSKGWVTLDC